MVNRTLNVLAVSVVLTLPCWAELQPDEVAILVAKGNRESVALANYYAKQRQIPTENICQIAMPVGEDLDRATWDSSVRPAIRDWFEQNGRHGKIRCMTTTWGVPIRIGAAPPAVTARFADFYQTEFDKRLDVLAALVKSSEEQAGMTVDGGAGGDKGSGSDDENTSGESRGAASVDKLGERLEAAVGKMQADAAKLPPAELQQFGQRLQVLVAQAGGLAAMYDAYSRSLRNMPSPSRPQIEQIGVLRGQIIGLAESRGLIERQQLSSVAREETSLALVQRAGGLMQSLRWLQERIDSTSKNETVASFDSELSLVLWPEYELLRWQTNFLHANSRNSWIDQTHPTIMVSRLDAPTLALAKGLVDGAMNAEKQGLKGKIYLDARGLADGPTAAVGANPSAAFDQQILRAAEYLKAHSKLDVVLDQKAELFQPGECPDAALYCGWYSLADYVDAFEWSPGAIGYHVASAEAITLKTPGSNVWCKRMLEDGVCATMGPVGEPYLQAFPDPGEFFAALVDGHQTLVECYYLTKPYNSWMLMLVGDPLYRPFGRDAGGGRQETGKSKLGP